ncbi:MAG: hypothetical protein V3U54_01110, partial [Thermodesulfobacteriota bacterium]
MKLSNYYLLASLIFLLVIGIALGVYKDEITNKSYVTRAEAAKKNKSTSSPVKALSDRDVYYPGSEDIKPDEMRVIACGTGMPNARPKQAAACFLVELGNGDKFIFDIGTGSAERISA